MDSRPSGFSVHWTSQARILEWVGISLFSGFSQPRIEPVSPALEGWFFTTDTPSCSYAELLNARSRDNQVKTLISHLMKVRLRLNKSYEIQGIFLLKNVKNNLILNFNSFPFLIIILSCQDFDNFSFRIPFEFMFPFS